MAQGVRDHRARAGHADRCHAARGREAWPGPPPQRGGRRRAGRVMAFSPATRRLLLTCHVVSSVGWIGAVVTFLGLSAVALTTTDEQLARGAYLAMESIAWL